VEQNPSTETGSRSVGKNSRPLFEI
jgi:hypothetical protein